MKKKVLYSVLAAIMLIYSGCEKEVSVTPPDEPPPHGFLMVNSYPEGASIFLNGKERRRQTPDSLTWLDSGYYEITLKKEYFKDYTDTVLINEEIRNQFFIDYRNISGMLTSVKLNTNPSDADIYFEGDSTGFKTPYTISNILPGIKEVVLKKQGYMDAYIILELHSSTPIERTVTLLDTVRWDTFNMDNSPFPTNRFTYLYYDIDGSIYAAAVDNGLMVYNNGNWTRQTQTSAGIPNNNVRGLRRDELSRLWIFCTIGYSYYTDLGWMPPYDGHDPPVNGFIANDIEQTSIGLLISTNEELVVFVRWNEFIFLDFPFQGEINDIAFSDSTNKIWFATSGSGLVYTDADHFGTFTQINRTNSGIPSNEVLKVKLSQNGFVWAAMESSLSSGGGISVFNGYSWVTPLWKTNLVVNDIYIVADNKAFVSTSDGLYEIENGVSTKWDEDYIGIDLGNVTSTLIIDEYLWISTAQKGLHRFLLEEDNSAITKID